MNRKAIRNEIADLITARLGSLLSKKAGTQDPAVYRGQVATFGKARAAVVVSSAGTAANFLASRKVIGVHDIAVDIFVLYADAAASWNEELAEDLLDDLVEAMLDLVANHQSGNNWTALDWKEISQNTSIEIGGTEYRREQIILHPS